MSGKLTAAAITGAVFLITACTASAASTPQIEVLSNRADLISGGEALVRVTPAPAQVTVAGRDETGKFGADGVGLIDGLQVGANVVTARLGDGRAAQITITDHPIGGPVFAGPQVQPWVCQAGALDAQCNRPITISYQYKDANTGQFTAYDPSNPPAASSIATTTTDQGKTVPYIVRVENGDEDRGQYAIAELAANGAWNHKLLTTFGPNTAPHYSEPSPSSVLDDKALSRGFMVANNGLQIHGENTNDVVSTESFMMLKEHIIDTYGSIRYTIAQGCSGGSYQVMDEAMYPGLIDGLQPNCTFVDLWTTASDVIDCGLLVHYFSGEAPGGSPMGPWVPAIDGHKDPSDCAAWYGTFYNYLDPTQASHCNLPASEVYNPQTNPGGARCTVADYMVSIFGRRPPSEWTAPEKTIGHGFANLPWGNEGVQYGLQALRSGQITPAEFVDLNQKIGGITIDGTPQAARDVVDENTASIAYRSGAVTDAKWIADVPIIDLRAYTETGEIHTSANSVKLRARLDATNGNHNNEIEWIWNNAAPIVGVGPPPDIELKSFLLMDRWLSRVEADKRDIPKARKVALDKPTDAVDACFVGSPGPAAPGVPGTPGDQEITDPGQCNQLYPPYSLTRPAAGAPATDDIIQCSLSPINPEDYLPAVLSPAQIATLEQVFPHGVCDYRKPGVGQQDSIPWMTYQDGPGGRPLGPAPVSTPIGAGSPAVFSPGSAGTARCVSLGVLRFALHAARGDRVTRVLIYLNGRLVRRRRGTRITAVRVSVPAARAVVRIVTISRRGTRRISRRAVHGCRKGRPTTVTRRRRR